ncbi:hypothetical protein [Bythopirellula goksoeyrii]|uniref:hypothetical protein n=1 Tax=Bythopirellula goksoeyrii TaxID=1400387 RepID=UPI0011CE429C|nr:hypothetical protein [Bythopirellula goksoeyrii]
MAKELPNSTEELGKWIIPEHPVLSIAHQCELIGLPRSTWHYQSQGESPANLALMRLIDKRCLKALFYDRR